MPITPRALSYFWVGTLWVALTAIQHEGSVPRGRSPFRGGTGAAAVAASRLGGCAQAALPEPGACEWPSAPSLHLVSRGRGGTRKPSAQNWASMELTTHSHLHQIRGRSGELRQICTCINQRLERRYIRSVIVPFSSSTSLAFGGSTACFSRSSDALYLCWGEHFRYIPLFFKEFCKK